MGRITEKLSVFDGQPRKGFIPFVTAGDPDLETSLLILQRLAELGSDVIEVGVPFSDPMADGETIQRSSQRALDAGIDLGKVIDLVARFRRTSDVPVVLFSYFNPVFRYGIDRFCRDAAAAGVDGVLLTDVIDDEAAELSAQFAEYDIDLITLVAPTTSDERLATICENARGFLYAVSRAGVTGARQNISSSAKALVERARRFTDLPIAVGFGISTPQQVGEVWEYADAAVVGSAIVAEIEAAKTPDEAVERVDAFVSSLLPKVANRRDEI